jgi:hypothetical protein
VVAVKVILGAPAQEDRGPRLVEVLAAAMRKYLRGLFTAEPRQQTQQNFLHFNPYSWLMFVHLN